MVDVLPVNEKLVIRATRMIQEITGVDLEDAKKYLELSGKNAKVAICMILCNCSRSEAEEKLIRSNGFISKAL
jgi:N-acetylmuramic acid 6-phosphate etherase